VDGMTYLGEEDRVRHWRVVPFPGEMRSLHAEGLVGAGGRGVAAGARGNRPAPALPAADGYGHPLCRLVDRDQNRSLRGRASNCEARDNRKREQGSGQRHKRLPRNVRTAPPDHCEPAAPKHSLKLLPGLFVPSVTRTNLRKLDTSARLKSPRASVPTL